MEAVTIKVPVGKILSSTDRKYGGEGNIETLAQSIKAHGLIHPLAVKEIPDKKGHYRVIAGRRRHEAVKSLGWKSVEVTVYPEKSDDEAIALAENVNREDMHPLDEAEKFRREIDSGKTAEEVAKYYARSVSGIHQRVRLTNLIAGIKTMFRDGKISLSGAALIASLPEEDQEKFLKKYGRKSADKWEISSFMRSAQKHAIKHIADQQCGKCRNRTHNTAPGLFEDYRGLEDVCFDAECYAAKWQALIGRLIAGQAGETENSIILSRGVPAFLPKNAKAVAIGGTEYALLPHGSHSWKETAKKSKAKTAWLVSLDWPYEKVEVARVAYEKYERQPYADSQPAPEDPVKDFMIDQIPGIDEEDRKAVAKKVREKYRNPWNLRNEAKETLLEAIVNDRIRNKAANDNLAALYLAERFSGTDDDGNWHEIDPDCEGLIAAIFGPIKSFSELPATELTQKIFLLLIAVGIRTQNMPDPHDSEEQWQANESSLFWKFAKMGRDEYIQRYKEILDSLISQAVKGDGGEPGEGG